MSSELDKTFDPAAIEAKWYAHWETNGLFRPERPDAVPFTLVNPPPNVTGSLHIGHALDNTLQDVVIRYERLRGKDALWVVGMDHAGIATQMVVERQLEARQDKRTNYSREEFVDKIWQWKAESGGAITGQLRRLGCSMDWSREQFTMDPHFTRAVLKVFVDLYNQGLIYRDKRLVNWDPKLKTAISDLEVETQEIKGGFWHFRYPLADGVTLDSGADHIVVATTRPETMLADMAVAVNADDPRYQSVIGKEVVLPITGRRVPIIADEHADPELGSGAVKITPGHDFNDFEVGKRMGIKPGEMLNMFNNVAQVTDEFSPAPCNIPAHLIGLDRFEARKRIVDMMDELDLLEAVEDRIVATPFGDRSNVVIEPILTDQWYVDAGTLAQPPMQAVRDGRIEIVPKTWEKTFFNWMENIQPWCISRQLWWGHRIPAWYGPEADANGVITSFATKVFVAETEEDLHAQFAQYYGADVEIVVLDSRREAFAHQWGVGDNPKVAVLFRDEDVLDTWFSSALWPFATLGWPEEVPPPPGEGDHAKHGGGAQADGVPSQGSASPHVPLHHPAGGPPPRAGEELLTRHYPNDLLISGFDILFFWDARMAMQGIHFMQDVPWKRLYLHGLVRAPDGQKMSKSKGNVIDPLGLIDKYGADALRFFMAAMESQGRDIKMDEKRVEGYRNFATKLWNATRFCQANGIGASTTLAAPEATLAVNKWIVGEVVETLGQLDKAMAELRFDAAANTIYHFVWDNFCDWYLELIKPVLSPTVRPEPVEGQSFPAEEKSGASTSSARTEVEETQRVAGWVLDQILVMLHPFMPFITEELWHAQGERRYELILAKWPEPKAKVEIDAKAQIELIVEAVKGIRSARNELNIPPGARMEAYVAGGSDLNRGRLKANLVVISKLARIDWSDLPRQGLGQKNTLQVTVLDMTIALQLEGIIDIEAEKARLAKALDASTKEAKSLEGRLSNPAFVEKAKPEAVEKARADHAHHAAEAERLAAALARLG